MTVTLQIDDVPSQVAENLAARAAAHNQTVQQLLLDLLTREASVQRTPLTRTQAHRIVEATEVA